MRNKLSLFIFFLVAAILVKASGPAEHTYEYYINGEHKCQALKIKENIFLTAAHCVAGCISACSASIEMPTNSLGFRADGAACAQYSSSFNRSSLLSAAHDAAIFKFSASSAFAYDFKTGLAFPPDENTIKNAGKGYYSATFLRAGGGSYKLSGTFYAVNISGPQKEIKAIKGPFIYLDGPGIAFVPYIDGHQGMSGSVVYDSSGILLGIISNSSEEGFSFLTPFTDANLNIISSSASVSKTDIKTRAALLSADEVQYYSSLLGFLSSQKPAN